MIIIEISHRNEDYHLFTDLAPLYIKMQLPIFVCRIVEPFLILYDYSITRTVIHETGNRLESNLSS